VASGERDCCARSGGIRRCSKRPPGPVITAEERRRGFGQGLRRSVAGINYIGAGTIELLMKKAIFFFFFFFFFSR